MGWGRVGCTYPTLPHPALNLQSSTFNPDTYPSEGYKRTRGSGRCSTEGPSWRDPKPVLGALSPFLEPFCGYLSPRVDKINQK